MTAAICENCRSTQREEVSRASRASCPAHLTPPLAHNQLGGAHERGLKLKEGQRKFRSRTYGSRLARTMLLYYLLPALLLYYYCIIAAIVMNCAACGTRWYPLLHTKKYAAMYLYYTAVNLPLIKFPHVALLPAPCANCCKVAIMKCCLSY